MPVTSCNSILRFHPFPHIVPHLRIHCIHTLHFHWPFISWWTSRMLPFPGDCKESIRKHGCVSISTVEHWVLWACAQEWNAGSSASPVWERLPQISTVIAPPTVPPALKHPSLLPPLLTVLFTVGVLDDSLLTGVRWSLRVVIVCICLMAKDIKHSSKHLLAIYTSFEKYLFSSFAHLLKGMVLISLFGFWSTFKHSRYSPFTWTVDGRFFSQSVGYLPVSPGLKQQ